MSKKPRQENWHFKHERTLRYKGIDLTYIDVYLSENSVLLVYGSTRHKTKVKEKTVEYTKDQLIEYQNTWDADGQPHIDKAYEYVRRLK